MGQKKVNKKSIVEKQDELFEVVEEKKVANTVKPKEAKPAKKKAGVKGRVHESGVSQASVVRDFKTKIDKLKQKKPSDEQLLKLINEFKENITKLTDNTASIGTNLAKGNVYIGKVLGVDKKKLSDPILKPTKEDKDREIAERKEVYLEKLQNRIQIDYNTYLNAIDSFKDSKDYNELIACVILVTGRRMTEVTKTGIFSKANDEHFCVFAGQLKKKDSTTQPYEIPLIKLTFDELSEIITRLRKLKDLSKTEKDVAISKTNKKPNDIFKSIFGVNVTSRIIRGAYAYITYRLYSNPSVSEIVYGAEMLGHKEGDLTTFATNYNKVFVTMNDYSSITTMNNKLDKILEVLEKLVKQSK